MKRPSQRAWPKEIVEIPTSRPDSRADPQATQKISRQQLDEVLKRTKSGMRRMVRPEHERDELDEVAGPRDDSPELIPEISPPVTIVSMDSVELEPIEPPPPSRPVATSVSRLLASPRAMTARAVVSRDDPEPDPRSRSALRLTPRSAFITGIAVAVFIALAAIVGFLAGRGGRP